MKQSGWFLILLSIASLTTPSLALFQTAGHPGISRIELPDAASRESLSELGRSIWWISDRWALVDSNSAPDARPLVPPSPLNMLYLIHATEESARSDPRFAHCVALDDAMCLVSIAPDSPAFDRLPGVRLPHPVVYRAPVRFEAPGRVSAKPAVQSIVNTVSSTDLMADVTHLADYRSRHSMHTGCEQAGEWLRQQYHDLGYAITTQRFRPDMAPNVIAESRGLIRPDEIVVICAHYDSINSNPRIPTCPGADDNGTGTAAILQTARLLAGIPFDRTLRIVSFAGEEEGLFGSYAYAERAAAIEENIVAVYNYDMVGWVSPAPEDLDVIGNPDSMSLVGFFIECADAYTSLPTVAVNDATLVYSDHSPFWLHGYPAFLGIEDEPLNYPYYHNAQDTPDKIDVAFFTETVRALLAATIETAVMLDAPPPTPTPLPEDAAVAVQVMINQAVFQPGDTFILGINYWNDRPEDIASRLYLVLDIGGEFWFWPAWEKEPSGVSRLLASRTRVLNERLISFTWPDVPGSQADIRFWSAFLDDAETRLIGMYDMKSFGYEE
mgnify:CR=1 FL=1